MRMIIEKVHQNYSAKRFSKWSSLYNNIHPSRRLPSISTVFLMFWGILISGNQHSQNDVNSTRQTIAKNNFSLKPIDSKSKNNTNSESRSKILKNNPNFAKLNTQKTGTIKPLASIEKSNPGINENQERAVEHQNLKGDLSNVLFPYSININQEANANTRRQKEKQSERNMHFEIYATPSLMNGTTFAFGQNDIGEGLGEIQTNQDQRPFHLYKTREIEAGGALLFDISSSFRLKAGMQFNVANYALEKNDHLFSNPSYITTNGNKNSANALTNAVYQLSIPLGTEWKLVGNGWIDWFAGATVQPSLMLSDPSFFQKDNELVNIDENAVFRKWNVHSSFETFVNYHLTKNTSIKLGPQLRYQLMPSLLPTYNVTERLYNVGLKLGLTGNF